MAALEDGLVSAMAETHNVLVAHIGEMDDRLSPAALTDGEGSAGANTDGTTEATRETV